MNPDEFYIGEDERVYVSPTVSRDEQLEFIDTLRDQIGKNNTLISAQTEQLGTDIQPSLGGLTGSEGYFQQRYQTTPVEYQMNTLKATAQAKALNDLMQNYANQAKNRYQQAYRAAQKRAAGGGGGNGDGGEEEPLVEYEDVSEKTSQTNTPPKMEDYWITGEEQTKRLVERTGLPDWLVNILKVFGGTQ